MTRVGGETQRCQSRDSILLDQHRCVGGVVPCCQGQVEIRFDAVLLLKDAEAGFNHVVSVPACGVLPEVAVVESTLHRLLDAVIVPSFHRRVDSRPKYRPAHEMPEHRIVIPFSETLLPVGSVALVQIGRENRFDEQITQIADCLVQLGNVVWKKAGPPVVQEYVGDGFEDIGRARGATRGSLRVRRPEVIAT